MRLFGRLIGIGSLCALTIICMGADRAKAATAGPVKTNSGPVAGTVSSDGKVSIFRGIPYAAPPVGDLRWKAPQPVKAWTAVLHADDFGPSCMQDLQRSRLPWDTQFMAQNNDSEDCLTLNVFAPADAAGKRLPVVFWIHGGGFTEGSSEVPVYDGTELAKTGIVVVTINYRLGIFGLMAHPELTAESPHHASGNYGYLDQVAALEWVKRNIASFGGDPARVTIDGQSAGAGSVHALISSPLAKGLFSGAIAESGSSLTLAPHPTLAAAEKAGVDFAAKAGAHSLSDLRAMPAQALFDASKGKRFPSPVDGYFLTEDPIKVLAEGKENKVPFITGIQREDFRLQVTNLPTVAVYKKMAADTYGAMADAFLTLYPANTDAEAATAMTDSSRDKQKASMYLWALETEKADKTPVYTYFFTHALPDPKHPEFGAFHTGEVPYTFRNLAMFNRPFTPMDQQVSDTISSYWKNFFATGNPNGAGLAKWTPVSGGQADTEEIGDHTGEIPLMPAEKLAFWKKYYDEQLAKVSAM
jgi:para-nitrobenzyl esterase